jgi:integrase
VEYELVAENAAQGKRRRLKAAKPKRIYLDSAEQIVAVLDAARVLDGRQGARTTGRYALVSALLFAGLRASEAGDARGI